MAFRTEIPIVVLNVDSPYNPIATAPVVVYSRNADGTRGSATTVYTSANPSNNATVANPGLTTDAAGRITGWLNRGAYEVVISVPGHPDYSEFLDSTPADDGSIDTDWIADSAVVTSKLAANAVTAAKIANTTITDAQISASAAIAYSKLSLGGGIVNTDVSPSAAIALSKLANVTAAQVLLGDGTGVVTGTALSGDATITSGGVITIASNAVTSAKILNSAVGTTKIADAAVTAVKILDGVITGGAAGAGVKIAANTIINENVNSAAAIAYSKLALTGAIVNADVNASAGIVYSKLSLANSIVNADISASAAIVRSKLNFGSGLVNADIATGAGVAYSKLNLAGAVVNADVASNAAIAHAKLATTTPGYVLMGAPTTGAITATQLHGDITVAPDGTVTVASISGSGIGANSIGPPQLTRLAAGKLLITQGTGVDSSYIAPSGDLTMDASSVFTIGANKVDSGKLKSDVATDANRAVTTDHIRDNAITTAKITANTITSSKIARDTAGAILIAQGAGSDVTFNALSGDVTLTGAGVTSIGANKVTNAMLAGSVALGKLVSGASGQIIVGDGSGVPTYRTLSGDATISNTGAIAIGAGAVTGSAIADASITGGTAGAGVKLAANTVTNANISPSAGITSGKLDSGFLAQVGVSDAGATRRGHFERATVDSISTTGGLQFKWAHTGATTGNPGVGDDGFTNITFPTSGMALIIYRAALRAKFVSGTTAPSVGTPCTVAVAFNFYDGVNDTPGKTIYGDGSVADSITLTSNKFVEVYTTGTNSDGTNGIRIDNTRVPTEPTEVTSGNAQMYAVPLFFFVPSGGTYAFGVKFGGTNGATLEVKNRRLDLVTFATS